MFKALGTFLFKPSQLYGYATMLVLTPLGGYLSCAYFLVLANNPAVSIPVPAFHGPEFSSFLGTRLDVETLAGRDVQRSEQMPKLLLKASGCPHSFHSVVRGEVQGSQISSHP